jgi:hypothetical protein
MSPKNRRRQFFEGFERRCANEEEAEEEEEKEAPTLGNDLVVVRA